MTRILLWWVAVCGLLLPSLTAQAQQPDKEEKAPIKRVVVGKNVTFETQGENAEKRRVLVQAEVCLREGCLEHLVTRKFGKEHEAILVADADARHIHFALLLAGARPLSPVQFAPKFVPAIGTRIKISLRYEDRGKTVTVPAREWLVARKDRKLPEFDWVFAGSKLVPNPDNPNDPPYYLANVGDVICVSNFEGALLDVNIDSTASGDGLLFEANTSKIPGLGTRVTIILEPVVEMIDLTRAQLDALWKDLEQPDARGRLAVFTLINGAKHSVPYLRDRVRPREASDQEKQVFKLIQDLDDDSFEVRERASQELLKLGKTTIWLLRAASESTKSAEVKRRLTDLLDQLRSTQESTPEQLREERVIDVLESIRSKEAKELLARLAEGPHEAQSTVLARRALERLKPN